MDFRDLFRNFLGINRRIEPPKLRRNSPGRIEENEDVNGGQDKPPDNNDNANRNDWRSRDRRDFLFGDMLSSMEDMFKEMEQSFSEIDTFFQDFGNNPFGFGIGPLHPDQDGNFNEGIPSLPPPQEKSDENVRNLVLKEPEKTPAINKSLRMDRDLDDLFSKSELPFTELPEAPSETPVQGTGQLVQRPKWNIQSSFERVYSTHSFKNGRWEGKTVRENKDGKEITTYTKNSNGEQEETTEFIPNTSTSSNTDVDGAMLPRESGPQYNPFQIFERLFKPRL